MKTLEATRMNVQLFNFCLFLLWSSVALFALVIGPLTHPKVFADGGRMPLLGYGAMLLALWQFIKWWSIRQRYRQREYRREMEEAYRRRTNPPAHEQTKPILNPEFQFEDERHKIPPPPPPNGAAH